MHILQLQLSGCALLLSKIMYLSLAERLCLLWDHTYIHLFWQASLSLTSHRILFLALLSLLFSFLRIFFVFSFCLFMSFLYPPPPQIFPHPGNSTQLSFIQFHRLFNCYFICIFITISIFHLLLILYLPSISWHSRNPTETTTPQANSSTQQQPGKPRLLHTTHVLSIFIFANHLEYIILPSSIYSKLSRGWQYQGYQGHHRG